MEDHLIFEKGNNLIIGNLKTTSKKKKSNFNQWHSTAKATKNILEQLKKSTLIGCDMIVN
jgi:hypothetical protein